MSVTVSRVGDGVLRLHCRSWRGRMVGYDVSAYVVRGVLVDTGFPRVGDEFLRALDGLGLRGVVVTHQHEDHAGCASAIASRGTPMLMHPGCETVLRERPPIAAYRSLLWGRPTRLASALVSFDPAPLEVIPLPGHTDDHVAVWDAGHRVLASGDLFLGVKVRVAHHDERPSRLVRSLRRAAALEPALLLDAHRGPVPDPAPLLRAKADWIEATIERVGTLSAAGCPAAEITRRVLGREEMVGWISRGEYSRRTLVDAILGERA